MKNHQELIKTIRLDTIDEVLETLSELQRAKGIGLSFDEVKGVLKGMKRRESSRD